MAHASEHFGKGSSSSPSASSVKRLSEQSQLDFELDFFNGILENNPDYVDVLRVMGNNLTLKGRYQQGLQVDKRLVDLRPHDPLSHYNLACSYALTNRPDQALTVLRQAVELGYRDFRFMREDHDLDSIRTDPRYRELLHDFEDEV
ncbi:MAG: hypothetical protein AB7K24_34100 [Gemmataceae bacterium]